MVEERNSDEQTMVVGAPLGGRSGARGSTEQVAERSLERKKRATEGRKRGYVR